MARTGATVILLLVAAGCASSPDKPDPGAARAYLENGRQAAGRGDHPGAIGHYTKAIQANPEMPEAYYERGYSNVRLRLAPASAGSVRVYEDRALADYGTAIRLDPTYADAYFNRAMVLSSRAQFKAAAEDLLYATRFKPKDPEPHLWLGRLYEEKFEGRAMAALDHYEKYVDLGGTDQGVREKVKEWKELKKQMSTPSKAPTPEEEKKAEGLHDDFKRLFAAGQKAEAVKTIEELISKYGHTQYVQKRTRELTALLNGLRAAPKDAPGKP